MVSLEGWSDEVGHTALFAPNVENISMQKLRKACHFLSVHSKLRLLF